MTVGTFLGGRIHVGLENHEGGRAGDPPSNALARRLREREFAVGRLKTGTPPRIDGRSIDFSRLEPQPGDDPRPVFSCLGSRDWHPAQVPCHITRTNERTHAIIRSALDRSPMYTGVIDGTGPRYCPSVEDKVVRFAERGAHQIFVEPEGLDTAEVYPNGSLHEPPVRRADRARAHHSGLRARAHHPPRLRHRVRLLRPAGASALAGDAPSGEPVLRRPDQRHHRLRGGGRPGARCRRERRAACPRARAVVSPPSRRVHRGARRRSRRPRHERAVSHVHEPGRVPPDAAARTTRICV